MPCFSHAEVDAGARPDRVAAAARSRRRMAVRLRSRRPRHRTGARGRPWAPPMRRGDGYIDAPRNVLAYTAALTAQRRRRPGTLRVHRVCARRAVGSSASTPPPVPSTPTAWCSPAARSSPRSARWPAGGSRPAVPATRWWSPRRCRRSTSTSCRWCSTCVSGIYWRPGESGGLLWGMSNPDEAAGRRRRVRLALLPEGPRPDRGAVSGDRAASGLRRTWAATIDYTPDHLPILGPLLTDDGPVDGHRGGQCRRPRHDVGPGGGAGGRRPHHDRRRATGST